MDILTMLKKLRKETRRITEWQQDIFADLRSHAVRHQNGGGDEINVAGLSGELTDLQKVKDHTHQSSGGGVGGKLDHGLALNGLGDDDHPQYLNTARHDTPTRHPLANLDPLVCSEAEADSKIATHEADASAHHAVHLKTLADHPLSIIPTMDDAHIPAAIARDAEVDDKITTHKNDASAHHTKTTKASEITSERFSMARMPDGTNGYYLKARGTGVDPVYAAVTAVVDYLNDLGDVSVPTPTDGYVLYWDAAAGKWQCKEVVTTVDHLNDIGDVNVPAPADGYFLYWDGAAGKWKCKEDVAVDEEAQVIAYLGL